MKKVSGKKKLGASELEAKSKICHIVCENGMVFKPRSHVKGPLLIEMN